MKRDRFQKKIDLLIDGEIAEKEREQIEKHLSECERCYEIFQLTMDIKQNARNMAMPDSIPDWNRLESKLASAEKTEPIHKRSIFLKFHAVKETLFSKRMLPFTSAAAAIFLFLVFINLIFVILFSSAKYVSEDEEFLVRQIKAAEQIFEANIRSLKDEINSNKENIPPDVMRTYRMANNLIEQEIIKCNRLVSIHPDDRNIMEKLFISYRSQINLHRGLIKSLNKEV